MSETESAICDNEAHFADAASESAKRETRLTYFNGIAADANIDRDAFEDTSAL